MTRNHSTAGIDVHYVRANHNSSPEQRLEWLVTAQEFAGAAKSRKIVRQPTDSHGR